MDAFLLVQITIIGFKNSPSEDKIKTLPTIGAVQEKLIKTRVNAIKNIPIIPPWSAFLFILFNNEFGKVISNAPKNDKANMKNIKKNIKLKKAFHVNHLLIDLKINLRDGLRLLTLWFKTK